MKTAFNGGGGGAFTGGGNIRRRWWWGLWIGNDKATMEITSAVVGGNGGRQRLTAVMDEGGRWRLTVAMDGSCGSGGR